MASLRFIANFGINLSGNNLLRSKTVLLTLLSMVNFAPAEWEWQGQKFSVQSGQTITSLQHIAERCGKGVNAGNVRGALDRFVKLGFSKRIYKDRTPADCRELGNLPVP